MRVLQFIWKGVLAFDRIGSRIPQLIQIWLIEFFFAVPLTFFIAKLIDIRGAFGVPGSGESLDGVFWGALVVSLILGFFFFRSLVRPRVVRGSWTPMVSADLGEVTVYGGNRQWTTSYDYLTSHPSYALLLLLTAPIPATMVLMTANQGDSTFYWRVAGIVGLIILALMAVARLLAWYVFRFGRSQVDNQAEAKGMSQRRLGWSRSTTPTAPASTAVWQAPSRLSRCTGRPAAPDVAATTSREPVCWLTFRPEAMHSCSPNRYRCPTSKASWRTCRTARLRPRAR
jgi:hypothetical protein